jgi:hypothetical protein
VPQGGGSTLADLLRTTRTTFSHWNIVVDTTAHITFTRKSFITCILCFWCCISLTSLMALLCTFSISIASFLFMTDQTTLPYSKWGLTRLLYSTKNISYLGLPTLQYRRIRADLVETYKIINNIDKVDCTNIFPIRLGFYIVLKTFPCPCNWRFC